MVEFLHVCLFWRCFLKMFFRLEREEGAASTSLMNILTLRYFTSSLTSFFHPIIPLSLCLSVRADTCQRWPRRPASPQWSSTTPPCRPRCPPSRSPRPTQATPSRCPQLLPPTTETMTSRCYDARTYVITYSRHTHSLTDDYYYVIFRAPPMTQQFTKALWLKLDFFKC